MEQLPHNPQSVVLTLLLCLLLTADALAAFRHPGRRPARRKGKAAHITYVRVKVLCPVCPSAREPLACPDSVVVVPQTEEAAMESAIAEWMALQEPMRPATAALVREIGRVFYRKGVEVGKKGKP